MKVGTYWNTFSQNTRASIKIFSEPMPNSNERSIQLMGTRDQIIQCASHFLEEISKVDACMAVNSVNGLKVGINWSLQSPISLLT